MRRLGVLVLVAGMVLSGFAKATKRPDAPATTQAVTVAQLEQALSADHGMADKKLAVQIADMKLTERLSDAETARLQTTLPGRKSQMALLAVADESAFLDPPAAEIPALPVPDHATQEALINKAMDYVLKQIPTLPDFFATRVTARFSGTPQVISTDLHETLFPYLADTQRLTDGGTTSATVRYSRGLEVFTDRKGVKTECHPFNGAIGIGEFSGILPRVAYEATQGKVVWSHWEQGPAGPLAVFHYEAKLVYKFPRPCRNEIDVPPTLVNFRGEIAVDPDNGSILRLTEMSRANPDYFGFAPLEDLNTMVEFGSVEIGGSTYLCPVRSVFIGFEPPLPLWYMTRSALDRFDKSWGLSEDPVWETLNDIVFTDYHLFRAKVRILTGAAP